MPRLQPWVRSCSSSCPVCDWVTFLLLFVCHCITCSHTHTHGWSCCISCENCRLSPGCCCCVSGQDQVDNENRVYTEYIKVPLDSGSLLIMQGAVQNDWQVMFPHSCYVSTKYVCRRSSSVLGRNNMLLRSQTIVSCIHQTQWTP